MMERGYEVRGMTCGHCTAAVEEQVGALAGVAAARADLSAGRLLVRGEAFDDAAVAAAVEEAGYEVVR